MDLPRNKPFEIDIKGLSVMIGIPTYQQMPWQVVKSLCETLVMLKDKGISFSLRIVAGCSIVEHARIKVAQEFLQSDCNRLFMIDADVVWEPQDFLRLLALSTKMECVGGIYPAKMDVPTFMLRWGEEDLTLNEWGCVKIRGMGLGFTCVQRTVIEQLAAKAKPVKFSWGAGETSPYMFRQDTDGDDARGEDMAFFDDVQALGYTVNLDPTVSLGHVGTKVYAGSILQAMRQVK